MPYSASPPRADPVDQRLDDVLRERRDETGEGRPPDHDRDGQIDHVPPRDMNSLNPPFNMGRSPPSCVTDTDQKNGSLADGARDVAGDIRSAPPDVPGSIQTQPDRGDPALFR